MNSLERRRRLGRLFSAPSTRAYVAAYVANGVLVLGVALAYRLAKMHFAESEFSEYAVLRRFQSFLVPLLCMGLGIALTRQVAYTNTREQPERPAALLVSVLAMIVAVLTCVSAIAFIAPESIAQMLWGERASGGLVIAAVPALCGTMLHAATYAYLRGRFWLVWASSLNVLNMGLVPILALLAASTVQQAFVLSGAAMACVCGACVAFVLASTPRPRLGQLPRAGRSLLRYGLPRVPGDLTLSAMFYLPVMLTAHYYGMLTAGYVAYSLSLIALLQAVVAPISTVMLPEAAMLLRNGEVGTVRRRIVALLSGCLGVTLIGVVLVFIWAEAFLRLHLGDYSPALVAVVRIAIIGALPFNAYVCLRSVVDAASERPIIARCAYAAMAASLAMVGAERILFPTKIGPLLAFHLGLVTLAVFTAYQTVRVLRSRPQEWAHDDHQTIAQKAA